MSTATAIATRLAAEKAATSATVAAIQGTNYNEDHFRAIRRAVINSARNIPSTIGGGAHGHTFLLESNAEHRTRTGGTGYTEATAPDPLDFTNVTTNVGIARVREAKAAKVETYNTQEGCRTGLRKLLIANVPADCFVELEDPDSGLNLVKPRDLLALLKANAAPVTVTDARALKAARNAFLTFDNKVNLATQFALKRRAAAEMQCIHGITSSESKLMM